MALAKKSKLTLAGLVGAATIAIVVPFVQEHEGDIPKAYFDVVGVPTFCFGSTEGVTADDVLAGKTYTAEECRDSLESELVKHAQAVLRCTPSLRDHPNQLSAAISLAYNIGSSGYCGSTVAKRFNSGDWPGACEAFKMWNRAGGRVVQGLVNRRNDEARLCLRDIPEDKR
ncbi:MAG: lysozyme [Desulfovibrio sp.]|jgi:lysozyme|nr:lysozyme [Desulfovibrio sp.]